MRFKLFMKFFTWPDPPSVSPLDPQYDAMFLSARSLQYNYMFQNTTGFPGSSNTVERAQSFIVGVGWTLEVVKVVLEAAQICVAVKFFLDTRKIEEVGWLPRLIVVFSSLVAVSRFLNDLHMYFLEFNSLLDAPQQLHQAIVIGLGIIINIPIFLNIMLWLRFLRVQAQIKTHKENTDVVLR